MEGLQFIHLIRKPFEKFNAIYFVEPTEESIQNIIFDFKKNSNDPDKKIPMYNYVHIIFNRPIKNELITRLLKDNKILFQNLCSLKQINFTVHPIDEGLFSFRIEDPLALKPKTVPLNLDNHILSILSLVRTVECLQIVYDSSDMQMSSMVEGLQPMFQKILDVQFEQNQSIRRIPPVFLILLDRRKDLVTPLLQNNSYESMFYNLLEKTENVLEFKVKNPDPRKQDEDGKSLLNEKDFIWTENKYRDCIEVIKNVNTAYQKFMEENASNQSADVLEQIRKAPELKEYIKDFNKHRDTLKQIMDKFKETKFSEVFFYEQCLATGMNKSGDKFKPSHINKSNVPGTFDKVRLSILAKLLHQLDDNSVQNIIFDKKDVRLMTKINDLCNIIEKTAMVDLGFLGTVQDSDSPDSMFYRSRAAHIFYEKITGNLGEVYDTFETVDIYPKNYSKKVFSNYIFKKNTLAEGKCPIVILFMKGGISQNEVMEINNLKKISHLGDFIPICGGTEVFSARGFMKYLESSIENVGNL